MKTNWKTGRLILFLLLCLGLNFGGKELTACWNSFLWLDSVGTVLCAYVAGPVIGSMLGVTGNVLFHIVYKVPVIYLVTSVTLALLAGWAGRRRGEMDVYRYMLLSSWAVLSCTVISLILNIFFYAGATGNAWGDGVIALLLENGVPAGIAWFLGQFVLEMVDKPVTVLLVILLYALFHRLDPDAPRSSADAAGASPDEETDSVSPAARALALLAAVSLAGGLLPAPSARAEDAALYDHYVQTVYSSKNGLPCGEANDIAQTDDGILWIGTYAGLYRYNGQEFQWMNQYDSVRTVNCLFVDEEGRLWIGTNDSGLSILIREKIVNVISEDQGLPSNSVRIITQSSDGYYYVGTTSSLQIMTLSGGLKTVSTLREINYADDAAADDRGHVAVVTNDGRIFLMKEGKILSSRQITDRKSVYRTCTFDAQGRLLAGTSAGKIDVYDISGGFFNWLEAWSCDPLTVLKDLHPMPGGEIFVSSDSGIGFLSPEREFHLINTNDFNASIDRMLVDYQGNLWFTSSRLGLLRMTPSEFRNVYAMAGFGAQVVNAVVHWGRAYYIGTDKGLDIVNESFSARIESDLSRSLAGTRIRCLMVDTHGSLWICTYGSGVIEVTADGDRYVYNQENSGLGNRARMTLELRDGTILAGCDNGVSFLKNHQVVRTVGSADGLSNTMILTATELPDGRILAGTDGDGIAVLENGEISRMLTRADGLSSGVILRTVMDSKSGGVFLVTSNGLCFMEEDFSIRPLNNFPYFNNYNLFFRDPDTLMVLSSAGIYVVNREELLSGRENLSYELLDSRRGLNSALTANAWGTSDAAGNLYLPCDDGVYILNADQQVSAAETYRMSIPQIRVNGESFSMEGTTDISVQRDAARIEFFPEVLNYTIQDPTVGYRLEGFDTGWSRLSLSPLKGITYTNLPAGDYTFHLAVFKNDQEDILAERTWSLTKHRAFYDEPIFFIYLGVLSGLLVIWIVMLLFFRVKERQDRELAEANLKIEMADQTIFSIARAVDAKDEKTNQHSARVSAYSSMIAEKLGLPREDCENIRRAALMHDIGKIGIPDSVLKKAGRLTDEEYAIMKSHTTEGAKILKDFTLVPHVVEGTQYHHERYDGRGYPQGLKGENIPLYGRIIGVADAFDAMTASRVYRKQMDFDYVLGEIQRGRGTQFDPKAADALLALIDSGKIDVCAMYGISPEQLRAKEEAAQAHAGDAKAAAEALAREAASRAVAEKEAADLRAAEKEAAERRAAEKSAGVLSPADTVTAGEKAAP